MKTLLGTSFLALLWLRGLVACAASDIDPFVGTWQLAPDECRYEAPSQLPQAMTIVMNGAPNGIIYRSHTVHRDGRSSNAEYKAGYDELPALVTGTAGLLAPVALKQINRTTVLATYSRAFQVVARSRRILDQSENTMTISTTEYHTDGTTSKNIAVYHRSPIKGQSATMYLSYPLGHTRARMSAALICIRVGRA